MPVPQLSTAAEKDKPDEVIFKAVVKLSSLIIALTACVLFILFVWYLFVLKPALSEGNPMDITLTKKLPFNTPLPQTNRPSSQELEFKTETETQLISDDVKPTNEAFGNEEKPEAVQRNKTTRRTNLTHKNISIKSAKSKIARSEKEPTLQSQEPPRHQNEYKEDKKVEERAEEDRAENKDEDENEDTAQKIKSFTAKLKESFLIPATQSTCTQVQIAMNQCPN